MGLRLSEGLGRCVRSWLHRLCLNNELTPQHSSKSSAEDARYAYRPVCGDRLLVCKQGEGTRAAPPNSQTARRSTAARSAFGCKTKRHFGQVCRTMRNGARDSRFTGLASNFAVDPWRRLSVQSSCTGAPRVAAPCRALMLTLPELAPVLAIAPVAHSRARSSSSSSSYLLPCPCPCRVRRRTTANWLFKSVDLRRCIFQRPNVRAKGAPTVGRQARAGENVPRTARPGLVARRWCSL